ncbi:hypothetical protein STENM223S_01640 [Streptomyces tendae]
MVRGRCRSPWLGTNAASASAPSPPDTAPGELDELSIAGLHRRTSDGQLDAERITRYYLDRIRHVDPLLHAVIEVNPDALREVRRLDALRDSRGLQGALAEDRAPVVSGAGAGEGAAPAAVRIRRRTRGRPTRWPSVA